MADYPHEKQTRRRSRPYDAARDVFPQREYGVVTAAIYDFLCNRGLVTVLPRCVYPALVKDTSALVFTTPSEGGAGRTPFWTARLTYGEPRWCHAPWARGESYIWLPTPSQDRIVVVSESPMDVLAAWQLGVSGIAVMGKMPPEGVWRRVFKDLPRRCRVIFLPHSDALTEWAQIHQKAVAQGIRAGFALSLPYKDFAEAPLVQREVWAKRWQVK